jgi:heterodisulfide reductase subunit B
MVMGYYPGCSLISSAREMEGSFLEVLKGASVEVERLGDWSCCGSSPAHSTSHGRALLLGARNLVLAEQQGLGELVTLCPSCYVRLWETHGAIVGDEGKAAEVKGALGRGYGGGVRLRFFLEVLEGLGVERLLGQMKRPLSGVRAALYYGCLLSRQAWITGFDVGPYEGFLQSLVEGLGAQCVRWSYERHCCGAYLAVPRAEVSDRMVDRIRREASRAGANCLVVFCPLCQMNLELRGTKAEALPVLYITELIGIAAQHPHTKSWLKRHLVSVKPLLSAIER